MGIPALPKKNCQEKWHNRGVKSVPNSYSMIMAVLYIIPTSDGCSGSPDLFMYGHSCTTQLPFYECDTPPKKPPVTNDVTMMQLLSIRVNGFKATRAYVFGPMWYYLKPELMTHAILT